MTALISSVTQTDSHATRFRLTAEAKTVAERHGWSKSGGVAKYLVHISEPVLYDRSEADEANRGPELSVMLQLTIWQGRLLAIRLGLPSACCGEDMVPDLRHGEHFCPKCHRRFRLAVATDCTLWAWEGLDLRGGFAGDDVKAAEVVDSWLALRTAMDPLVRVLQVRQLLEELREASHAIGEPMAAVREL